MNEQLRNLGWSTFFDQQLADASIGMDQIARVAAHHGGHVSLLGTGEEFQLPTPLAESAGGIAVGDWLVLSPTDRRAARVLERQTLLCRKAAGEEAKAQPIAANIDTIFLVCSCNEEFNLSRIERYLALILQSGATPVVVLTKADLVEHPAEFRRQAESLHRGLLVETLDARDPAQTAVLKIWCKPGRTIGLLGSSGVGKSTLANALGVEEQKTGAIREKDGKGRHTTTSRSLHLLPGGGVLVDNPGMRELQLPECEDGVAHLFEDVLAIASRCRFSDCRHQGDAGCAVEAAVESGQLDQRRFHSFMKLNAEQARNGQSLRERRRRERQTGRLYKSIIATKRRRQHE